MRISHRITIDITRTAEKRFLTHGIDLKQHEWALNNGVANLDISEDHPNWADLRSLLSHFDALDVASTEFSQAECAAANYLVVRCSAVTGFPGDDYKEVSYDMTNYCPECGTGLVQIAPIRMSGEPKWGGKSMFQLNWIDDAYFVKPEVWESVFRPFGIPCRDVSNKRGHTLRTVVQLDIQKQVPLKLSPSQPADVCRNCGRPKYHPVYRGWRPAPEDTDEAMFKATQDFGYGHSSHKEVLVNQALYQQIAGLKSKGIEFAVCKELGD